MLFVFLDTMQYTDESSSDVVKTSIEINTDSSDHGRKFSCITKFDTLSPAPEPNGATNVPDYSSTLTSEPLDIRCKSAYYTHIKGCFVS